MARKIDYTNLSEDDLQYLADRTWLITEGDYQGFKTSETVTKWRETGEVPDFDTDGDGDGEDEGIPYKDAKVGDLRTELEHRKLETTGTKAELIARLEANDAEADEEPEEDDEEPEEDEEPTA